MRLSALAVCLVFLSCGCEEEWRPLDPGSLKTGQRRSVGVVVAEKPRFSSSSGVTPVIFIPGAGIIAAVAIGAAAGAAGTTLADGSPSGQALIDQHGIPDPAVAIGDRVAAEMAKKYALEVRKVDQNKFVHLFLRMRTTRWYLTSHQDSRHFKLVYGASLDLYDREKQRVLAGGTCELPSSRDDDHPPTYDELANNHAELLKRRLAKAAAYCSRVLLHDMFGIYVSRDLEDSLSAPGAQSAPILSLAACHLEEKPEWKRADAAEKSRMIEACGEARAQHLETRAAQPANSPAAAAQPLPRTGDTGADSTDVRPSN